MKSSRKTYFVVIDRYLCGPIPNYPDKDTELYEFMGRAIMICLWWLYINNDRPILLIQKWHKFPLL